MVEVSVQVEPEEYAYQDEQPADYRKRISENEQPVLLGNEGLDEGVGQGDDQLRDERFQFYILESVEYFYLSPFFSQTVFTGQLPHSGALAWQHLRPWKIRQ